VFGRQEPMGVFFYAADERSMAVNCVHKFNAIIWNIALLILALPGSFRMEFWC